MADRSENLPSLNPLPLWNLAHAYCETRAFHAANELDIFTKLDEKGAPSKRIEAYSVCRDGQPRLPWKRNR